MSDRPLVVQVDEQVRFDPDAYTKIDLALSPRILLGLNCLEPGQSQAVHSHADQDKFYYVIEGAGAFILAGQEHLVFAGGCVWAPAGVDHGLTNGGDERLVVLVGIAPAPAGAS